MKMAICATELALTCLILVFLLVLKFHREGWVTLATTAALILAPRGIWRECERTRLLLKRLDDLVPVVESVWNVKPRVGEAEAEGRPERTAGAVCERIRWRIAFCATGVSPVRRDLSTLRLRSSGSPRSCSLHGTGRDRGAARSHTTRGGTLRGLDGRSRVRGGGDCRCGVGRGGGSHPGSPLPLRQKISLLSVFFGPLVFCEENLLSR